MNVVLIAVYQKSRDTKFSYGRNISEGSVRKVYKIDNHPDKIIKVSIGLTNISNWREFIMHEKTKYPELLGKIYSISRSGKYLIMENLPDTTKKQRINITIPTWWTDRMPDNFGTTKEGIVKIRDYGNFKINECTEKYNEDQTCDTNFEDQLKFMDSIEQQK